MCVAVQVTYKPNSVPPALRKLAAMIIHLRQRLPVILCDLPGSESGPSMLPYLVLLRVGFASACPVTSPPVRSYRTISPLPAPIGPGGIVSVALSVGSRRPAVNRHSVRWSSDFPPACRKAHRRPSSLLTNYRTLILGFSDC